MRVVWSTCLYAITLTFVVPKRFQRDNRSNGSCLILVRSIVLFRGDMDEANKRWIGHGLIPHVTIPFFPDYFVIGLTIPVVILTLRNKHRLMILRRFFYVHGRYLSLLESC